MNSVQVYQVTRLGHENCDVTEGELLDISALKVDDKKLVTLYDKDLTDGLNLLISESQSLNFLSIRFHILSQKPDMLLERSFSLTIRNSLSFKSLQSCHFNGNYIQ